VTTDALSAAEAIDEAAAAHQEKLRQLRRETAKSAVIKDLEVYHLI
jgi:hypothetical protein